MSDNERLMTKTNWETKVLTVFRQMHEFSDFNQIHHNPKLDN